MSGASLEGELFKESREGEDNLFSLPVLAALFVKIHTQYRKTTT
jgi:hypothetical protein